MQVRKIPVSAIEILPDRQRSDYGDIAGLAASLKAHGQLQPIVVTEIEPNRYRLVAGGRRMRAIGTLQWTEVAAVLLEWLPQHQQELLELEENVRRKDLEWPEYVEAVARYVALSNRSQQEVAGDLQIAPSTISIFVVLADAMKSNAKLRTVASWRTAYDLHQSQEKKAADSMVEDAIALISEGGLSMDDDGPYGPIPIAPPEKPIITPKTTSTIFAIEQSFLTWAPNYSDRRFNLIHCDFPYGLNMQSANLQGSSDRWNDEFAGRYDDTPELFDQLVRVFFDNQDKFISDTAHCIFWLAHKNVGKIMSRFRYFGWEPCEVPLIWHKSDGAGIAPDTRRQPRRTYEIAIFASRGDRGIAKVKAASVSHPTTKEHHLSEKPLGMISHFMEMVVDEYSEVLDPTCGSGTALEACLRLGAKRVLGLDVKAEHVAFTQRRCAAVAKADDPLDSIIADI